MLPVSVIIVSYNTRQLTLDCIASVLDCINDIEYEIILVDNASSDGSTDAVRAAFPQVKIVENSVNLGFGKANNIAVAASEGEYLFFLNSDCLLRSNVLFSMLERMRSDKSIAVAGCRLTDLGGATINSFGEFPSPRQEFKYLCSIVSGNKTGRSFKNGPRELDVDYVCGADMLIPRNIFEAVGGFDEKFFLYFEETDLQKRIAAMGLRRIIFTDLSIIHLDGGSFRGRGLTYERFLFAQESCNRYLHKHYSGFDLYFKKGLIALFRLGGVLTRPWSWSQKRAAVRQMLESGKL